jgi:TetR/AcrR family transcriptional regulator, cholesterol catabolism regulator
MPGAGDSAPEGDGAPGAGDAAAGDSRRRGRGGSALASQRRDNLVKLAAELFAKKGYQATTVREIADEAGILSGSLYHHFDSKESIVDEVLSSFLDDLLSSYRGIIEQGGGPRQVLAGLVEAGFASLGPHRAAITVMQNDWSFLQQFGRFGYLAEAELEVEKIWVAQIESGQRGNVFRGDIDAKLTYRMIRDTIWLAVRWFQPDGRLDTAGLAEHYIKVLFDGVCVEHGVPATGKAQPQARAKKKR